METIRIDAKTLMDNPSPLRALCDLLKTPADSLMDLRQKLLKQERYVLVEVGNWPVEKPGWSEIADMLENVQQHSETFFLVWGTDTPVKR